MSQVRYFIRAEKAAAEAIYARLEPLFEEHGAPLSICEADEAAGLHEVSVYFEEPSPEREAEFAAVVGGIDASARVETEVLPDIDWMSRVLTDLKPVRAGRFLVHGAHDRGLVAPNDLSIEIEAGQAFGTGHHGTTAGCLEMIDRILSRRSPQNALDLGTGSGVLAIALAKLARRPVLASDIDPVAVRVARENIRKNGVHRLVKAVAATGFASPALARRMPFDLIVANILAGPLMKLAPSLKAHLSPGGDVVLSGILHRQREPVLAAYRQQGLFHRRTLRRGEWVTLHLS